MMNKMLVIGSLRIATQAFRPAKLGFLSEPAKHSSQFPFGTFLDMEKPICPDRPETDNTKSCLFDAIRSITKHLDLFMDYICTP